MYIIAVDNTIKLCMHRQSMLLFYSLSSISFIYNDFPIPPMQKPGHKKIILQTMILVTLPAIMELRCSFLPFLFTYENVSHLKRTYSLLIDDNYFILSRIESSCLKSNKYFPGGTTTLYWILIVKFKWKEWHSFFTTPCRRRLSLLPFCILKM